MKKEEILEKIQSIFRSILDNDDLIIDYKTTSNDIEEWDSLTHIQLIVAIEKTFQIKFTSKEIHEWKDVEEMIESMKLKL
jgi:acyl carrier protein